MDLQWFYWLEYLLQECEDKGSVLLSRHRNVFILRARWYKNVAFFHHVLYTLNGVLTWSNEECQINQASDPYFVPLKGFILLFFPLNIRYVSIYLSKSLPM